MRPRLRRWIGSGAGILLIVGLSIIAGRGGSSGDQRMLPEPVAVTAYPIAHFRRDDADERRFGPLAFVGGLELRGRHHGFGGLSAIRMDRDGERFLALTDTGDWVAGRIQTTNGAPSGLADVVIAPMLTGEPGRGSLRTRDAGLWDGESLALDGETAFVGVERDHAVLAFDLGNGELRAPGRRLPLPAFLRDWPENAGIEALGILPPGGPYAGRIIGLSERSGGRDEPTEGFVMGRDGSEPFRFRLRRSDGFDVTDLDFLPSGDMVVLERYFSPRRGVAMRLRRVKIAAIGPDALVDGETLLTADGAYHVDNMEGLSIHRGAAGETFFTLISDDNFSIAQRTLLLRFRWLGD